MIRGITMAKSKYSNDVKDDEKTVKQTNHRRKSKSERTIDAQIELTNEEILKQIELENKNSTDIIYKRPLRKL